jgi:hypothetical protein
VALFYCGVDLGQAADYTAVVLLEEALYIADSIDFESWGVAVPEELQDAGWVRPSQLSPKAARQVQRINFQLGRPPNPPLFLVHLERYELGTPYPKVIEHVSSLLARHPIRAQLDHTRLLIDATGVGRPVVDSFRAQGVHPISILIHGGERVHQEIAGPKDIILRTPKRDLVAAVQTLLQNNRLQIAAELALADVLRKELLNFRVKIDPLTAHDSYSHWRTNAHDDLVLATACAAWYREYSNLPIEERNRAQGGYQVPTVNERAEPLFKGAPQPFILGPSKPSGPNPWHGLNP